MFTVKVKVKERENVLIVMEMARSNALGVMARVISLVRTAMEKEENQMEMNVLIVVELEKKDALIVLEKEVSSAKIAGEMEN